MSRISVEGELQLRRALEGGVILRATALLTRLELLGLRRNQGHALVTKGAALGLLVRLGRARPYRYQLNIDWKPSATTGGRDLQRQAGSQSYEGPVFDRGPLVAGVGLVCGSAEEDDGELPPMLGARLVGELHRNFDEIFQRCE